MRIAATLTAGEIPGLTLYMVLASAAPIFPVVTWPVTHTLWMAMDLELRPVGVQEALEAQSRPHFHQR